MMKNKQVTKLIHGGNYAAEVDVTLITAENGWSPYISVEDAKKLDDVRQALRDDDLETASNLSRVYKLTPIIN